MPPIEFPDAPLARAAALRSLQREERLLPSKIRAAKQKAASFEAAIPVLSGKPPRLQAALDSLQAEVLALEQRLESIRSAVAAAA